MRAPSRRVRTLLSLGLLGLATVALVPLGCAAQIRYPEQQDERPRVPDATAERLRECVDERGGDLPRGEFTFDATVTVDEDGQVVDVKGKGVPHEELAICMRMALRGMTVPEELLRLPKLRLSASRAPADGQAAAERGLMGHPGVLVAVAVALAELVIQVGPTIVVLAASVELSGEIAEAIEKRPRWVDECNKRRTACLHTPLQSERGDHWNSKRCDMCHNTCMSKRKWPDEAPMHDGESVSCVYKKN